MYSPEIRIPLLDYSMKTGKGITFVIRCEATTNHNWMAFASWYSINKNLPDAKVVVAVKRSNASPELFRWVQKCGGTLYRYKNSLPKIEGDKIIEIEPTIMALRTFQDGEIVPAKSSEQATLVDYSEGVGRFVATEWIDKVLLPFPRATRRWATDMMSVNEVAILELWQKCGPLYEAL